MAEISAKLVKELRDRTGLGMMECKKALQEADGDIETAIDNLRKSGQAKAAKKAGIETIAIYDKYSDADTEAIKAQADFYLHNYTELLSSIDEL